MFKKIVLICCLSLVWFNGCGKGVPEEGVPEVQSDVNTLKELVDKKQYDEALKLSDTIIERYDLYPSQNMYLCFVYIQRSRVRSGMFNNLWDDKSAETLTAMKKELNKMKDELSIANQYLNSARSSDNNSVLEELSEEISVLMKILQYSEVMYANFEVNIKLGLDKT